MIVMEVHVIPTVGRTQNRQDEHATTYTKMLSFVLSPDAMLSTAVIEDGTGDQVTGAPRTHGKGFVLYIPENPLKGLWSAVPWHAVTSVSVCIIKTCEDG
jgi:hypothetical protein